MEETQFLVVMLACITLTWLGIIGLHQLLYKYSNLYKLIYDDIDVIPGDIRTPFFMWLAILVYSFGVGIALIKTVWRKR